MGSQQQSQPAASQSQGTTPPPFPWVSLAVLLFLCVALGSQFMAVAHPESFVPGARRATKNRIAGIARMSDAEAAAKIRQDALVQVVILSGLAGGVVFWLRLRRRLQGPAPVKPPLN